MMDRARLMRAWGIPKSALNDRLKPGDRVRVIGGPWAAETRDRDVMVMWRCENTPTARRTVDIMIAWLAPDGVTDVTRTAEHDLEPVAQQLTLEGFE